MKLKKILESRFSIRSFQQKTVEREKLEYILECARLAPSACNKQPWLFIVVQSEQAKQKLAEVYPRDWFAQADCYIVACGNHEESWKRASDGKDALDIDISIASEHICLAVEEMELGTCWVCNFDLEKLKKNFNLPEYIEPIALFPIGYPKSEIEKPVQKRKKTDDIVKWI